MKKLLLISFALLGAGSVSKAQWVEQATGFPVASTGVTDISAVDTNIVWAIAYDGSGAGNNFINFTRTTNGGALWTAGTVGTDTTLGFSNIHAMNDTEAWVCMYNQVTSNNGSVWKTTNGGVSWTQSTSGLNFDSNSFANFVHFKDPTYGFIVGDPKNGSYEIYRTIDGGASWFQIPSTDIPAPISGEVAIVNNFTVFDDEIWFGTTHGRIYKSLDYGIHWTVDTMNTTSGTIFGISFRNHDNGLCIRSVGVTPNFIYTLYSTSNGGTTWTNIPAPTNWYKQNLAWVPGTFSFVSSSQDFTPITDAGSSYTIDDGLTWTVMEDSNQFGELEFVNSTTGWSADFSLDAITGGIYKWNGWGQPVATTEPIVKEQSLKAYPNPVSNGIIHLEMIVDKRSIMNVSLTDALGREVYSKEVNVASGLFNHNINISQLNPGIYFVVLECNGQRNVRKVMVQ